MCVAAAVLWMQFVGKGAEADAVATRVSAERRSGNGEEVQAVAATPTTASEVTQFDLAEADRDYQQTIEELRAMLQEDRPSWSEPVAAAVDAKLASYRRAAIEQRLAVGDSSLVVASHDPVYATYRAEISFLQSALAGELPGAEGMR